MEYLKQRIDKIRGNLKTMISTYDGFENAQNLLTSEELELVKDRMGDTTPDSIGFVFVSLINYINEEIKE